MKTSTFLITGLLINATFWTAVAAAETSLSGWTEKVRLSGDFRYRHEYTDKLRQNATSDSHRERLRVRFSVLGEVNEDIKVKLRLATSEGATPLATNQTMTDNASKKPIYFDMAYVDWKIRDDVNLQVGKHENPFRVLPQSQLIYDVDYTPEGLSLVHQSQSPLFAIAGAYSLQERGPSASDGTSEPDSWLLAAMTGWKHDSSEGLGYMVAAGYHNFTALKKNAALAPGAASNDFAGNSFTGSGAAGRYAYDYQVGEAIGELHWRWGNKNLSLHTDFLHNFAAEEKNQALLVGTTFSALNEKGKVDWSLGYQYVTDAKDATVSAVNNSDFANGINGAFGHTLIVSKNLAANTTGQVTYIHSNIDNNGNPFANHKVLADFVFVF